MPDSVLVLRITSTSLPENMLVHLKFVKKKNVQDLTVDVWTHSMAAFQAQPGDLWLLFLLGIPLLSVSVDVFFVFIIAAILTTRPI